MDSSASRVVARRAPPPLGEVLSRNLQRRHLAESQRALVAARLANMRQGERTDLGPIGPFVVNQPDAAKRLNVGARTVKRAKAVLDDGAPELVKAVESGEVKLGATAVLASERATPAVARWDRQP